MIFNFTHWLRSIPAKFKLVFASVYFWGILAHGMALFNKFSFHDDTRNLFKLGSTYRSGRWMLGILGEFEKFFYMDGSFSLPLFNGFLSMLFIALAVCIIIALLDIKSDFLCCFIGGLMVVFPSVTGYFAFIFCAHVYTLAMLMSVYGVYLVLRHENPWGFAGGILLMTMSTGIYQAFIPVSLCLFVLGLLHQFSSGDIPTRDTSGKYIYIYIRHCLPTLLRVILSVLLSLGLYFLINKLALQLSGAVLAQYKGIDNMGQASLQEYYSRLHHLITGYFKPSNWRSSNLYPHSTLVIYYICLAGIFIMGLHMLLRLLRLQPCAALLCALLLCMFPLCANFSAIMVAVGEVHGLMLYSQLFNFILFAWLADNLKLDNHTLSKAFTAFVCILCISLNLMYSRYDNKCYFKAQLSQQQAVSFFNVLIARIQGTEGYSDHFPVAIVNEGMLKSDLLWNPEELEDIILVGYANAGYYADASTWNYFIRNYCGFDPVYANAAEFESLPEVIEMPHYPDAGSVKVINNTVVVKY